MNTPVSNNFCDGLIVYVTIKISSIEGKYENKTDMSRVMRKQTSCISENKDADQLRGKVTAKLISAFVFAT